MQNISAFRPSLRALFTCVSAAALVLGLAACDDEDDVAKCEELGELCHPIETDLGQACHELGHAGDPDACIEQYDACIEECSAK